MKNIFNFALILGLGFSSSACSKESTVVTEEITLPVIEVIAKKEETQIVTPTEVSIPTKKTKVVCREVIGNNGLPVKNTDGTTKQTCSTIKIHQKYQGTPVPSQKN